METRRVDREVFSGTRRAHPVLPKQILNLLPEDRRRLVVSPHGGPVWWRSSARHGDLPRALFPKTNMRPMRIASAQLACKTVRS
jgi:hypothetical protein